MGGKELEHVSVFVSQGLCLGNQGQMERNIIGKWQGGRNVFNLNEQG